MKVAVKQAAAFAQDRAAFLRFAAEAGCSAVQLHLPDDAEVDALHADLRAVGLGVASVCAMSCAMLGPDRARQDHEARQVARALVIAERLGAPQVTVFAGHDPGRDLAGNAEAFAQVFAPLAEQAGRLGLRIGIENCPMVGGTPRIARNLAWCPAHWCAFFAACDHPSLGIEFDVSHPLWVGLDPAALIRSWAPRIHHVQIKDCLLDASARADRGCLTGIPHTYVPLGEGDLDAASIFTALADIGYAGFVTGDLEGGDRDAISRNVAAIRRQLSGLTPADRG